MIIERKPIGTLAYCGRGAKPDPNMVAWSQLIEYTFDYLELICDRTKETVYVCPGNKSGQYFTRNWLSEQFIGDWILSLDDDHTYEPDVLYRMLSVFNNPEFPIDVLCGVYQYRGGSYEPLLYYWDEGRQKYRHIMPPKTTEPLQIVQIGAGGAGHLMVRRSVFQRIKKELGEKPFDPAVPMGEDFSFFDRCRKLGIPVWVCPDIQSYHLQTKEVTLADYDVGMLDIGEDVQLAGNLMQPVPPEMR